MSVDDESSSEPISEPSGAPGARAARKRVLKGAYASFNHEFSAIPCALRDVSESGARVIFEGGWFVPDRFVLHVDIDGYKIECERVWQRGSECGVRFVGDRMVTGKPRQQVLTPDQETDAGPVTAPAVRDQLRPRPAPGANAGGFGRRTR